MCVTSEFVSKMQPVFNEQDESQIRRVKSTESIKSDSCNRSDRSDRSESYENRKGGDHYVHSSNCSTLPSGSTSEVNLKSKSIIIVPSDVHLIRTQFNFYHRRTTESSDDEKSELLEQKLEISRSDSATSLENYSFRKKDTFKVSPPCFNRDFGIIVPILYESKPFLAPLPYVDGLKVTQCDIESKAFLHTSELDEVVDWLTWKDVTVETDETDAAKPRGKRKKNMSKDALQGNLFKKNGRQHPKSHVTFQLQRNNSTYSSSSVSSIDSSDLATLGQNIQIEHLDIMKNFGSTIKDGIRISEQIEEIEKKQRSPQMKSIYFSVISKSNHDSRMLLNCEGGFLFHLFARLLQNASQNNYFLSVGFMRLNGHKCFDYNFECVKQFHLKNDPIWSNINPKSDTFVQYESQLERMESSQMWYHCKIENLITFEEFLSRWNMLQQHCTLQGHDVMSIKIVANENKRRKGKSSNSSARSKIKHQEKELLLVDLARYNNKAVSFDPNLQAVKLSLGTISKILNKVSTNRGYIRFKEDPLTKLLERSLTRSSHHFGSTYTIFDIDTNIQLKNRTKEVISFGLQVANIKAIEMTDFLKSSGSTLKARKVNPSSYAREKREKKERPKTAGQLGLEKSPQRKFISSISNAIENVNTKVAFKHPHTLPASEKSRNSLRNHNSSHISSFVTTKRKSPDSSNTYTEPITQVENEPTKILPKIYKHTKRPTTSHNSQQFKQFNKQIKELQDSKSDNNRNNDETMVSHKLMEEQQIPRAEEAIVEDTKRLPSSSTKKMKATPNHFKKKRDLEDDDIENIEFNHSEWVAAMRKMKILRRASIVSNLLALRESSLASRVKQLFESEALAQNIFQPSTNQILRNDFSFSNRIYQE